MKILVPASTSNLGPAFDAVGLALNLYNEFIVEPSKDYQIEVKKEGDVVFLSEKDIEKLKNLDNLFLKAYRTTCAYLGKEVPIKLIEIIRIPIGRGLGSSATAIVGGIVAAQKILNKKLSLDEFLDISFKFESHPDNVLPAYLGGLIVAATDNEVSYIKLNFPEDLKIVIVVPEIYLSTEDSRKVLPDKVSLKDAVFNIQHTALLIAALKEKRYNLLREAVKDKIHQPYRSKLIPSFWDIIKVAYDEGALAAFLSGAGSCMAAICLENEEKIGKSMCEVFESDGIQAKYLILKGDSNGAKVIEK